jgi:periplasmic copper chaperone A
MRTTLLALGASLMLLSTATLAQQGGGIQVTNAWARATPGGAQSAAAYVTLESASGDRLTGISTPVAQKAEVHEMTMDGSVMKMRPVDSLDLPAGNAVTLKPGGYHIMLTGLTKQLKEGETFPMTLDFAKAGARQIEVSVAKIGAMGPDAKSGRGTNMQGMSMPMQH